MGRGQTNKQTDGHPDSMKESAKGRFFENHTRIQNIQDLICNKKSIFLFTNKNQGIKT